MSLRNPSYLYSRLCNSVTVAKRLLEPKKYHHSRSLHGPISFSSIQRSQAFNKFCRERKLNIIILRNKSTRVVQLWGKRQLSLNATNREILQAGQDKIYTGLLAIGVFSASCLLSYAIVELELFKDIVPVVHADQRNKNNFIADVVEKAAPAVVFLEIKGRHPLTSRQITVSNGSGFIVRNNGVILTNAHVVANKSAVSVKLEDGRIFEGQVTAVDPVSDLALVKIPASNLPTISLGDSSNLRPGEWVIAMGSPLSLSNTVTCGIVSSVQRGSKELGLRNKDMDYIQTDAVINFGNSGGPLVDLEGRAIGINTMKVTTGISFAIPSDHAVKFLNKAESMVKKGSRDNGYIKRRYMGITMLSLTDSIIRELQKDRMSDFRDINGGVFVYKVIPGSPAHIGGLMAGDIIVQIDGVNVKSAADVYNSVEKSESLTVTIVRGPNKKNIYINTKEAI